MTKGRLEAFSDVVIAIIMTIMVLELRAPHGASLADLRPNLPVFLSYVLSFVYLGIYWNNHHHLLQATKKVNGAILWANMHLLFWLSIVPFGTAWMGENALGAGPVALYGLLLLASGIAYYILAQSLIKLHGRESALARAIGKDVKGILSLVIYSVAVVTAFWQPIASCVLYAVVAIIWLVPDTRLERTLDIRSESTPEKD